MSQQVLKIKSNKMTEQFVPHHMMQFQKLKHVVARYFKTNSTAKKSKQTLQHTSPFIQMNIWFMIERKIGNLQS